MLLKATNVRSFLVVLTQEVVIIKPKQEPRSKILSGGGGGGAKLDEMFLGEDAWKFWFYFSKVTGNAFITIKLLIFFHIFSDVAIGSTDINL